MLLVLFAGCIPGLIDGRGPDGTEPGTAVPEPPAPPSLAVEAPVAFDPLRAALAFTVRGTDGPVAVTIDGPAGEVAAVELTLVDGAAEGAWDGRAAGVWATPAVYTITARAPEHDDGVASTALVRAGFVAAWLEGDGGVTASREPLYWPADAQLADGSAPVAMLAALDDGLAPLDFPAVPLGILPSRPVGAEPAAFRYDSRPLLTLDPPLATGLDLADTEVVVEGWTALSGVPVRPGVPVVLQRDEPLGDTLGVSELDLALQLRAGEQVLGEQRLPLKVYRMLDPSQFAPTADRYYAWAPVLEEALPAIEGTEPTQEAAVDALVDFVFFDLGLEYDTVAGASAYSTYDGFDFEDPHFQLTDFLVRRFGSVINCTDAANILGAYANMVGAPLDHLILDPSFDLNYIQAIGETEFTSCPFGPGGCGFSYHAVTTIADGRLIWDATLALDGDPDPGALPATELLVQQIAGEEYLDRLVRSGNPRYNNQARETLQ